MSAHLYLYLAIELVHFTCILKLGSELRPSAICSRKLHIGGFEVILMSELLNGRYILLAKLSDATGEAWISAFNEQAEQILGRSAEDLSLLRSQVWPSKIICLL
jgi:hypothetical protein